MRTLFLPALLACACLSGANAYAEAYAAQTPAPVAEAAPAPDPYQLAIESLKSADPMIRRQGADKLGQLRNREAIPSLLELLRDPEPAVRAVAVDSLGLMRAPAHRLAELLDPAKEKDAAVRQNAAAALAYTGDPASADALLAALKDPVVGVRYAAVRSLSVLRPSSGVPALLSALQDSDAGLRGAIISALWRIRSPDSLAAARSLLTDKMPEIRAEAAGALARMSDEKRGLADLDAASSGETDPAVKAAFAAARAQLAARFAPKKGEPKPAGVKPKSPPKKKS